MQSLGCYAQNNKCFLTKDVARSRVGFFSVQKCNTMPLVVFFSENLWLCNECFIESQISDLGDVGAKEDCGACTRVGLWFVFAEYSLMVSPRQHQTTNTERLEARGDEIYTAGLISLSSQRRNYLVDFDSGATPQWRICPHLIYSVAFDIYHPNLRFKCESLLF